MNRVAFSAISLGRQVVEGLSVTAGRSGHMLGSCWLRFEHGGKSLLYTGDMTLAGRLLATDLPPELTVRWWTAPTPGEPCPRPGSTARWWTWRRRWPPEVELLLPVPPNGRGSDILLHLCENLRGVPVYAEVNVAGAVRRAFERAEMAAGGCVGRISGGGEESNGAGLPWPDSAGPRGGGPACGQKSVGYRAAGSAGAARPGQTRWCGRIDAMNRANTFTNAISLPDVQSAPLAPLCARPRCLPHRRRHDVRPGRRGHFEALKGDARNCILITGHRPERPGFPDI